MKVAVVCCLHGNEPYGLEVANKLTSSFSFFIGNKIALERKVRFIEADMNRCFPGKINGNYEEVMASKLVKKLKEYEYVIDLHSSSNHCPLFGIITKPNKEKLNFAKRLGLKRLVIMPEFFASGKALIDFVRCGISLEVGPHERKENVKEVLKAIDNFFNNKKNENVKIFEVFDIIKKGYSEVLIKNFDEVKAGQVISKNGKCRQVSKLYFTAVLVDEEAYGDILCLACRKYAPAGI